MKVIERRQAILEVLCERRFEKIDNLALEFGVHRNTILNDILELSLSYPIHTKTGRHDGGVYIADNYYIGKQYFSDVELQTIISLMGKADDDQKKVLSGIINKFGKR